MECYKSALIFFVTGLLVAPFCSAARAEPISSLIPRPQGDILYVGGSGPGNYSKIQNAIDNATPRDTIFVYSGTYYERLNVTKTLKIIGEDARTTIINSTSFDNISFFILPGADDVTISRFTVINDHINGYSQAFFLASNNNTITHNIIINRGGITIGNDNGITSNGNIISNNSVSAWAGGITISDSTQNIIENNYISNNQSEAICLYHSNNNIVTSNILSKNLLGISLIASSFNSINNNTIQESEDTAIDIENGANNNISHNTIIKNGGEGGISIYESTHNQIFRNQIDDNSNFGVLLEDCTKNKVFENNLVKNKINGRWINDPSELLALWHNTWTNNYWGRPISHPKAILGFTYLGWFGYYVPLAIPYFQFDWSPAQTPFEISTNQ